MYVQPLSVKNAVCELTCKTSSCTMYNACLQHIMHGTRMSEQTPLCSAILSTCFGILILCSVMCTHYIYYSRPALKEYCIII